MAKLKCVAHTRRVFVWDDGLGAVTVHREDGTRCVVNPLVTMGISIIAPTEIIERNQKEFIEETISHIDKYVNDWVDNGFSD